MEKLDIDSLPLPELLAAFDVWLEEQRERVRVAKENPFNDWEWMDQPERVLKNPHPKRPWPYDPEDMVVLAAARNAFPALLNMAELGAKMARECPACDGCGFGAVEGWLCGCGKNYTVLEDAIACKRTCASTEAITQSVTDTPCPTCAPIYDAIREVMTLAR